MSKRKSKNKLPQKTKRQKNDEQKLTYEKHCHMVLGKAKDQDELDEIYHLFKEHIPFPTYHGIKNNGSSVIRVKQNLPYLQYDGRKQGSPTQSYPSTWTYPDNGFPSDGDIREAVSCGLSRTKWNNHYSYPNKSKIVNSREFFLKNLLQYKDKDQSTKEERLNELESEFNDEYKSLTINDKKEGCFAEIKEYFLRASSDKIANAFNFLRGINSYKYRLLKNTNDELEIIQTVREHKIWKGEAIRHSLLLNDLGHDAFVSTRQWTKNIKEKMREAIELSKGQQYAREDILTSFYNAAKDKLYSGNNIDEQVSYKNLLHSRKSNTLQHVDKYIKAYTADTAGAIGDVLKFLTENYTCVARFKDHKLTIIVLPNASCPMGKTQDLYKYVINTNENIHNADNKIKEIKAGITENFLSATAEQPWVIDSRIKALKAIYNIAIESADEDDNNNSASKITKLKELEIQEGFTSTREESFFKCAKEQFILLLGRENSNATLESMHEFYKIVAGRSLISSKAGIDLDYHSGSFRCHPPLSSSTGKKTLTYHTFSVILKSCGGNTYDSGSAIAKALGTYDKYKDTFITNFTKTTYNEQEKAEGAAFWRNYYNDLYKEEIMEGCDEEQLRLKESSSNELYKEIMEGCDEELLRLKESSRQYKDSEVLSEDPVVDSEEAESDLFFSENNNSPLALMERNLIGVVPSHTPKADVCATGESNENVILGD